MSLSLGENDWQRETDHPSSRALLQFLEADVCRGLLILAAIRLKHANDPMRPELLRELAVIEAEVERWMACARKRRLSLGTLHLPLLQFLGGTDTVLRCGPEYIQ